MGPSKTTRIVTKHLDKLNDPLDKEGGRASRRNVKKRKLSDMVGSRWSEEELKHFYEAYRKHGKDWKKVASIFPNRSADIVEGLYNMNRAYLSLPDGMATVAGLVAMMTDHYNILDGSGSDQERNDVSRKSCKPRRHDRGKLRINTSKGYDGVCSDSFQHQSGSSSYGCLSLLKRNSGDLVADNRPRAVGKRTPRFPYLRRTVASALMKASQIGGSLQISDTPVKGTAQVRSSPVQSAQRKDYEIDISRTNYMVSGNENSEGFRIRLVEVGVSAANTRLLDTETGTDTEVERKAKKLQEERPTGSVIESFQFDDVTEVCSPTLRGYDVRNIKNESGIEVTYEKTRCPSQRPRKKHCQLTRDESCALDALHTLADLSLTMSVPSSAAESESGAFVNKQEGEVNAIHESKFPGLMSKNHECNKFETSLKGEGGHSPITGFDLVTQGCANLGQDVPLEATRKNYSFNSKMQNRKRKSLVEEVSIVDRRISCVRQLVPLLKEGKSIQIPECRSLSKDIGKSITESPSQDPTENRVNITARSRKRRKMGLHKAIVHNESSEGVGEQRSNECSFFVSDDAVSSKERLSGCLSSKMLRRWCAFEWLYSAIDYPWFARCEFQEYLDHVQLGHVPRLTRVEWSVIRSSLGKPRRLSKHFLREERKRLELYRESVRTHYAELRAGTRQGLPTDLAQPLLVGQGVSACHPKTREIHNGSVLSIDYNTCMVKFDASDLGVEIVLDIDCMPLNPWENMPEDLKNLNVSVDNICNRFTNVKADVLFTEWKTDRSYGSTIDATGKVKDVANEAAAQATSHRPCTLAQIQEREADIKALADLTRALNKKEALVAELRQMNEEVCGRQKDGDMVRDSESFTNQYATVLLNLQDVNDLVASALVCLRQRNTYQGNSWSRPMVNLVSPGSFNSSDFNQDSGSYVEKIVEGSRQKARTMVGAAVQAMSSLKGREDVVLRIGGLLSFSTVRYPGTGSNLSRARCFPHPKNSSLEYQDQVDSCLLQPIKAVLGISPTTHTFSKLSPIAIEAQDPSELISACVASLLMIQSCTERQYPPAAVARIMESAVTSMRPCCSQNIPIYREIETCMGIIKNQMLSLVPTPSSVFSSEVSV